MTLDLPTTIQIMPYAADVAQTEMAHPDNQLAATQGFTRQLLEEQNKQTQPIEPEEALSSVREEGREQRRAPDQPTPKRRRRRAPTDETTCSGDDTPFAGHLIDRTI